jgi:hypothetical protein
MSCYSEGLENFLYHNRRKHHAARFFLAALVYSSTARAPGGMFVLIAHTVPSMNYSYPPNALQFTKVVTATVIACAGDIACQKLQSAPSIDFKRTARMGVFTMGIIPAVHLWYKFLMRRFPDSALKRMAADQVRQFVVTSNTRTRVGITVK